MGQLLFAAPAVAGSPREESDSHKVGSSAQEILKIDQTW